MIYAVLIISIILESIFTNIVGINSLLVPLFLLTSISILYPCFKQKSKFIIICIIFGLIYDIIFGTILTINAMCFAACGFLISEYYKNINYNVYTSNILVVLIITFYRILSYVILCIIGYVNFNENILIKGIYSSLILNIVYGIVFYFILKLISNKFKIIEKG